MRGKMLDRLRGLGGKLKDDTVKEFAESECVVTSGERAARAWVSPSHEALQTCSLTQGNARFMNMSSDKMMVNTFNAVTRQFTAAGFGLHLFVPQIPGVPSYQTLKGLFGEAANGLVGNKFDATPSQEKLQGKIWHYFRMAVHALRIIDFPSFDFGFQTMLKFFSDNIDIFHCNGLPFCMVTREFAKQLAAAQQQRELHLTHFDLEESALLTYVETADLRTSREELLRWNREQQAMQEVQFNRSFQAAMSSGLFRLPETSKQQAPPSQGRLPPPRNAAKHDPHTMDKRKWTSAYGTTATGMICWWHCHSSRPCTRAGCPGSHSFPLKYKGKHFSDLPEPSQAAIMKACKK